MMKITFRSPLFLALSLLTFQPALAQDSPPTIAGQWNYRADAFTGKCSPRGEMHESTVTITQDGPRFAAKGGFSFQARGPEEHHEISTRTLNGNTFKSEDNDKIIRWSGTLSPDGKTIQRRSFCQMGVGGTGKGEFLFTMQRQEGANPSQPNQLISDASRSPSDEIVPPYPLQPSTQFIRPEFDNPDINLQAPSNPEASVTEVRTKTHPPSVQPTPEFSGVITIGKENWTLDGMPISGTPVPQLEVFDKTMVQFMKERNIRAATLAVMKDGKLLLAHGYGHSRKDKSQITAPDTTMRIASISKPFTAAAIKKLIQQGKISADTRAFPFLGMTVQGGDLQLNNITIQHLLDHQGGWDRNIVTDPMFQSREISEQLGKDTLPTCPEIMTYMLSQPIQFAPGSRREYSNFGYCILGRIIEKAAGQSYISFLQNNILNEIGVNDVFLGQTLPENRQPKEIGWYFDPQSAPSLFQKGKTVSLADGGFYLEAMDAHGGLVASSISLVKFGQAYWISGEARQPGEQKGMVFFGSLPGTLTMLLQHPNGTTIAVMFNQRRFSTQDDDQEYTGIQEVMDQIANTLN